MNQSFDPQKFKAQVLSSQPHEDTDSLDGFLGIIANRLTVSKSPPHFFTLLTVTGWMRRSPSLTAINNTLHMQSSKVVLTWSHSKWSGHLLVLSLLRGHKLTEVKQSSLRSWSSAGSEKGVRHRTTRKLYWLHSALHTVTSVSHWMWTLCTQHDSGAYYLQLSDQW